MAASAGWGGSDGHAPPGADTDLKLTFDLDHSVGLVNTEGRRSSPQSLFWRQAPGNPGPARRSASLCVTCFSPCAAPKWGKARLAVVSIAHFGAALPADAIGAADEPG